MGMVGRIRTNMSPPRMSTDQEILTLTQWLSPAFPVGAFAYSHGLETAIQRGQITTATDLEQWLSDVLRHGSGRNDAILLRAAYACTDTAERDRINATAFALCASSERVLESRLQGDAFGKTVAALGTGHAEPLAYPVAVGTAAAEHGLDLNLTISMYLHAFASALVSAAVRAVPLGQTEGQQVVAALAALCTAITQETQTATLADVSSTAFLSDIAAMQHETLQPRIFRS